MDNLMYNYIAGTNKLSHITDDTVQPGYITVPAKVTVRFELN
jgi:hypothetical protein